MNKIKTQDIINKLPFTKLGKTEFMGFDKGSEERISTFISSVLTDELIERTLVKEIAPSPLFLGYGVFVITNDSFISIKLEYDRIKIDQQYTDQEPKKVVVAAGDNIAMVYNWNNETFIEIDHRNKIKFVRKLEDDLFSFFINSNSDELKYHVDFFKTLQQKLKSPLTKKTIG
jgi:hypothetical protein